MSHASVLRAAIVPTVRATPLGPAAATCLLGCAPLLIASGHDVISGALVATIVITTFGVGFVLDDTAATTLEASPTTLLTRRALRVSLLLVVLSIGAAIQLAVAALGAGDSPLPVGAWLLQDAAFVAVTLVVSAAAQLLLPERAGGAAAAPTGLLVLLTVGTLMRLRPWLTPIPGGPHPERWGYMLAAAAAALLALSRDPGAPRRIRAWRSPSPSKRRKTPARTGPTLRRACGITRPRPAVPRRDSSPPPVQAQSISLHGLDCFPT
jgi:hypothetical protein